MAQCMDATT